MPSALQMLQVACMTGATAADADGLFPISLSIYCPLGPLLDFATHISMFLSTYVQEHQPHEMDVPHTGET